MSDCEHVPPVRSSGRYSPTDVLIYGADLADTKGKPAAIKFDHRWTVTLSGEPKPKSPGEVFLIVAAYGYAYEGHCYRFDKPKLLGFPTEDAEGDDPFGCGFSKPDGFPGDWRYRIWRVNSSKRIIELSVAIDDVKTLVLEANMPNSRVPPTYRSAMQLAHRNGRLTSG